MKRDALLIEATDQGLRLDKWLSLRLPHDSREVWKRRIQEGMVTVNDERVNPSRVLNAGDRVDILIESTKAEPKEETAPPALRVLFEDEWLLVVDKPAGLVVHPAHGHASGTLADAIGALYPEGLSDLSGADRPGIVHRLDKDTSGVMLIARHNDIHEKLSLLFRRRTIERDYDAVVWGTPASLAGLIDAPIARGDVNRKKMVVREDGKEAQTEFQVISQMDDMSRLRCRLLTGRTHQIRVHLAYIGHPVVGDRLYGGRRGAKDLEFHLLHASRLSFLHPVSETQLTVTSPLPERFFPFVKEGGDEV